MKCTLIPNVLVDTGDVRPYWNGYFRRVRSDSLCRLRRTVCTLTPIWLRRKVDSLTPIVLVETEGGHPLKIMFWEMYALTPNQLVELENI